MGIVRFNSSLPHHLIIHSKDLRLVDGLITRQGIYYCVIQHPLHFYKLYLSNLIFCSHCHYFPSWNSPTYF